MTKLYSSLALLKLVLFEVNVITNLLSPISKPVKALVNVLVTVPSITFIPATLSPLG